MEITIPFVQNFISTLLPSLKSFYLPIRLQVWNEWKKAFPFDAGKFLECAVPENIHTPPRKVFYFATPPPPPIPLRNSSLASYFGSKNLTFKTPLPLGISNDLPWGRYGFFLELHNVLLLMLVLNHEVSLTMFVLGNTSYL